jgi:hypothetical protein
MTIFMDETWFTIIAFLWGSSVGSVICAGTWWAANMPEYVTQLSLLPQYVRFFGGVPSTVRSPDFRMLVQANFVPRAYLRRFCRLRVLRVHLWEGPTMYSIRPTRLYVMNFAQHIKYYVTVAGALGSLLETGSFPELCTLRIATVGYHSGALVDADDRSYGEMMEDPSKPFVFYTWINQLALSIVRAVHGSGAPNLRHICLNDDFECAYFEARRDKWRRSDDTLTHDIRNQLTEISDMPPQPLMLVGN